MYSKMSSTGRPVNEISEFLLFTVTDGGHFGFYALENSARLFKRGVGAYFLQIPYATQNNRQTLLAECWSRNHSFGPYYFPLRHTILYFSQRDNPCTRAREKLHPLGHDPRKAFQLLSTNLLSIIYIDAFW